MSDEIYRIHLNQSSPDGTRKFVYFQSSGWEMDRLDNGVLMLFNENERSLVQYSPYAWQSVAIDDMDIDTTEDA